MMKKIALETYKRRAIFAAFKDRDIPTLSVTCNVDITQLKAFVDKNKTGFFVTLSFLIAKAVNSVPELRHRLINDELFEFETIDPGYTVLLDDETFSFCDSRYFETFAEYRQYANAKIAQTKAKPDLSTGEKHSMFFITTLPWFSFTSIVHPYDKKYASIPVVSIGKYFAHGDRLLVPIAIQAHHGMVDGIHLGKFYTHLSALCETPENLIAS